MSNPLAKLTMYDMLTMLVPGFLWCHLFWSGTLEEQCESVLFWVVCYIVGLIYHRTLDAVAGKCKCLRNNPKWIKKAYAKVYDENAEKSDDECKKDYYAAYYRLMKNNGLGNVPVLEAQGALLRNLILILGVYNFVACCCGYWIYGKIDCCVWQYFGGVVITLAVLVILFGVWYGTQMKIHMLIWEGDYYTGGNSNNSKVKNEETQQD